MNLEQFLDRIIAPGNFFAVAYKGDWPGIAHRFFPRTDIADAARYLSWATNKGWETWYAMASFTSATIQEKDGRKKLIGPRTQDNAQALKTFWVDADIKRVGDKKDPARVFADEGEVIAWVGAFTKATGIPRPNVWVKSGYGLHLYWTYQHALDRAAWQPYAEAFKAALVRHGFKGDINVVADSARILRPPDTWNYKVQGQPASCYEFYPSKLTAPDYPNPVLLDAIEKLGFYTAPPPTLQAHPPTTVVARSSNTPVANNAKAGMSARPRDFALIAANCEQVHHSLQAGGTGDSRDLWFHLVTLTVFCENGRAWAHAVSQDDPRYTQAETDREFDAAERDHQVKGIGPPLCKTFDADRPGVCQGCPHFTSPQITSPFHLGLLTTTGNPDELPTGYRRHGGWIERIADKEWKQVVEGDFDHLLLDRWEGGYRLGFNYLPPNGGVESTFVADYELEPRAIKRILSPRGIPIHWESGPAVGRLFMSWIEKLRRECHVRAQPLPSFGWAKDGGFSFGGVCYRAGGIEEPAPGADPAILSYYTPQGDLARWKASAAFVIDAIPELHTAAAISFGAPLMEFAGEDGACLSFVGESGVGKTSAFRVGASVWGEPRQTMLSLDDTDNAKAMQMGQVRALPMYWDEAQVTDEERVKRLIDQLHKLTQGRDKARLTATTQVRTPGEWRTLFAFNTNNSVSDRIAAQLGHTDATLLRVLEITIRRKALPYDPQAGARVMALTKHYGVAGRVYAQYLAANTGALPALVTKVKGVVTQRLGATNTDERFYVAAAAAIITGALIAKQLQLVDFDVPGIMGVLCAAIRDARVTRQQHVPSSPRLRLRDLLDDFLAHHEPERIVTRTILPPGPKALRQPMNTLVVPSNSLKGGLAYQLAVEDRLLRISTEHWKKWAVHLKGESYNSLWQQMDALWTIKLNCRGILGADTIFRTHKRYFEVSLDHTDLQDLCEGYDATPGSGPKVVPIR